MSGQNNGNGNGRAAAYLVAAFGTLVSLLLGMLLTQADTLREDVRTVQTTVTSHGQQLATIEAQITVLQRDAERGP